MSDTERPRETIAIQALDVGSLSELPPPPPAEHIMQFFAYGHLPPQLQAVSEPFAALAAAIVGSLPRNPERSVALRKLLESKDAAVRAKIAVGP
jgi:hypothetical protein